METPASVPAVKKSMKLLWTIVGSLAGIGAGVGAYFYFRKPAPIKAPAFKADPATQKAESAKASSAGKAKIIWRDGSYPLSLGSAGQNVADLQAFLGVV